MTLFHKETIKDDDDKFIDDKFINKFNIIDLFGRETLENIQDKISKATGLAFVTIDYKGEPITKMTSFSGFCSEIRRNSETARLCKSSDAFGGIQATVTQKNYVYKCPCGLLEIAIPIIVRGHYLGAFIGGQVRVNEVPKEVSDLGNFMKHSTDYQNDEYMMALFNKIQVYDYEKFISVAELTSLIINQLGEKEAYRLMQKNSLKKEVRELSEANRQLEVENNLKELELVNLKSQLNPYFLINTLNSISNLAVIEDSPRTNEMIFTFAEFLKQDLDSDKSYSDLSEEMDKVEKYLNIQRIRYGELLDFSINVPEDMKTQRIPCHIVMPFVEYSIFFGIATKERDGRVEITAEYENDDVVITISDNGMGFSKEIIERKFNMFNGNFEGESIQRSITNTRKKLTSIFSKKYDVSIVNVEGTGNKSIIRYPMNFKERNV